MKNLFWGLSIIFLFSFPAFGNESCEEAFRRVYQVESRFLNVKATFEGDEPYNSKVTNFQLSYTPPNSRFHPMRIIYGDRPIQLDGNDVLSQAHHNSQNSGKFGTPPTLEIGRAATDAPVITISTDGETLGDLPFNRLAINLKNNRFSPSEPGNGSTFLQHLLSYYPFLQPKGKWHLEAVALEKPESIKETGLVPVRAFERHEWDNSREHAEMMQRIHEEKALQATLPSYSQSARSISYKLDHPGLKLFFKQEGPY